MSGQGWERGFDATMRDKETAAVLLVTAGGPLEEPASHVHLRPHSSASSGRSQEMQSGRGGSVKARAPNLLQLEKEAFLNDRRVAGRTAGTLRFYQGKLRPFIGHLASRGIEDPEAVAATHIRGFLLELALDHSPGGVAAYYRALRAFFGFLVREGVLQKDPMANVHPPRVDLEILEPVGPETVEALLKVCDQTEIGRRDASILLTLLDSGLRAGEATNLDVGDFDPRDGRLQVRRSKSRRGRSAFVGKRARRALLRYLRMRGQPAPKAPLWLAYHRTGEVGRLSYSGLRDLVKRRAQRAGVAPPMLHSFRRAFAIGMLRAGADVVTVSRLLGHGSLPVVMRYLKQEAGDLARVHEVCSPADRLSRGGGRGPRCLWADANGGRESGRAVGHE